MSFPDRFELLELLREEQGQTFRARERATGRMVEVHFPSPEARVDARNMIDQGEHEGRRYVVTAEEAAPLDSAGAWRIKAAPAPSQEPGDFTRMFELRQAPDPASLPVSKPAQPAPASQPGQFTRAFQRPAAAPLSVAEDVPAPGQAGDFTRMFQTPESVPQPPVAESHPIEPEIEAPPAAPTRIYSAYIVLAIVLLCAIAVFVLVRLY